MQLPLALQSALDLLSTPPLLRKAREALTQTYKSGGTSASIFSDEAKRLAYLLTRMPATYAAVYQALSSLSSCSRFLDLGAGPGTASWAALELFNPSHITLIEQSPDAIATGKELFPVPATWIQQSLTQIAAFPEADVATLSYVLNEIPDPFTLVSRCWSSPIQTLVLVEPGTPKGFSLIRRLRDLLLSLNAHILAPCPHSHTCPIQGNDWCHFSARIERTRLHRLLKEGTLNYEDEKFTYLIASKTPSARSNRIIRHPLKASGHVRLPLCTTQGTLETATITKSNKPLYRQARDASWGDPWPSS